MNGAQTGKNDVVANRQGGDCVNISREMKPEMPLSKSKGRIASAEKIQIEAATYIVSRSFDGQKTAAGLIAERFEKAVQERRPFDTAYSCAV